MTRFISLGGDCQPAQQIKHNDTLHTHFFNWLTAPITSVHRLIETDFARFMQRGDLVADQDDEKLHKVMDTYNGINVVHDFKTFDEAGIKAVQARYLFLADKFKDMYAETDGEPPYFIRRWHKIDGAEDESRARALHALLISRMPRARLLYLHNDPNRPAVMDGSYRSSYLPQDGLDWEGDHEAWRFILSVFALIPQ